MSELTFEGTKKKICPPADAVLRTMFWAVKPSYVYCIWNADRQTAKIGWTRSPRRRFQQLQTASSDHLIYWGHYPGTRADEAVWHEALKIHGLHIRGEWFDASDGHLLRNFLDFALANGGSHSWD